MRAAVRRLARVTLAERTRREHWERVRVEREMILAGERRQQALAAARLRRAVLRVLPGAGAPGALTVLDSEARAIATMVGDEVTEAAAVLERFDLLAGTAVRDTLQALGLEPDRWRLVELGPPRKTRRLNRWGRVLRITPELLVGGTTGISRPLGAPQRMARYLAAGERTRLVRRLESDAKALHAFYRYGVLHGCVRLRWGFLDEALPVEWAQPGEPHLHEVLRGAQETGQALDVVVGAAPGWSEPWARARRVEIVSLDAWHVTLRAAGTTYPVDQRDIQAVRPAAAPAAAGSR
jgi:hypothetical protein